MKLGVVLAALSLLAAACGADPVDTGSPVALRDEGPAPAGSAEEPDSEMAVFDAGDTGITADRGPGWRLVGFERGRGAPYSAKIATSERGLDRMWEVGGFSTDRPQMRFDTEVLLSLTPSVSGACPDVVFKGVTISPDRVHGIFSFPNDGSCTDDANAVAFFIVAQREALPRQFTLSVEAEARCPGCDEEVLDVDLDNEDDLEMALWGEGELALYIDGTEPDAGTYAAVSWTRGGVPNALFYSPEEWTDEPIWVGSFMPAQPVVIEGYVALCDAEQCEECLGAECDRIERIGEGCRLDWEPVPFEDTAVTIIFGAAGCTIDVAPGS